MDGTRWAGASMETIRIGPMAKFAWSYSVPRPAAGQYLTAIFRDWHRAHLLGCELLELELDGQKKTALELERLNLWISAHGAWRASALPYWEARRALDRVFEGRAYLPCVGSAGGGRSAAGTQLEKLFGDRCQGGDSVALF